MVDDRVEFVDLKTEHHRVYLRIPDAIADQHIRLAAAVRSKIRYELALFRSHIDKFNNVVVFDIDDNLIG